MKKFEISAAIVVITLLTTASGAEAVCKNKFYSASDYDPIWWEGRDNARSNWSDKVAGVLGTRWAKWSKARDKSDECDWVPTVGANYCVAKAKPCK